MENYIKNIGEVQYNGQLKDRFMFPFSTLNYLLYGGIYGRLAIWYSKTDEGKSTAVSQILCECVKQKVKCFVDFGEDSVEEATERLYKQYIPYSKENYISANYMHNGKPTNIWEYHLTEQKWKEAQQVFDDYLYIFDIMKTPNLTNIIKALDEARAKGCRVGVIDNLENVEAMGDESENKFLKDVAITLRNYAVKYDMYIILVCHARKIDREYLIPEIEDIKGSSAVSNTAKDIVVIMRTDRMDKSSKQYASLKKLVELNNYDLDSADGLIMVKKTKGKSLGMFTIGFSKATNTYYECKKIDEKKTDGKPVLFAPQSDLTPIDLPEDIFGQIGF